MELVGPVLTQVAFAPVRAAIAETYKDSMDDTDSSGTRKRPRLDSGHRAYRSMSAENERAANSEGGSTKISPVIPDGQSPVGSCEVAIGLPASPVTPSKMTINVRKSVATVTPTQLLKDDNTDTPVRAGGLEEGSGSPQIAAAAGSSSPKVVSIASSPPNSPEIEVAEIEDMTDDPGMTRWKPLISNKSFTRTRQARDLELQLVHQFPHASSDRELKDTVQAISRALEKSILRLCHICNYAYLHHR